MKVLFPEADDPRHFKYIVWAKWSHGWVWYGVDTEAEATAGCDLLQRECDEGPTFITTGDLTLGLLVNKKTVWEKKPEREGPYSSAECKTLLDSIKLHAKGGFTIHQMMQWYEVRQTYSSTMSYEAAEAILTDQMRQYCRDGKLRQMRLTKRNTVVYYIEDTKEEA